VRSAAHDLRGDPQEAIDALDRDQARDQRHEGRAERHSERRAHGGRPQGALLVIGLERREVKPEWDHLDALPRSDLEAHEIVGDLAGDRHDARAPATQSAFDPPEHRRLAR